jgi:hypothetical protein
MDKMNITTAQYIAGEGVNTSITAVIDGVTMSVPLDPANRHYQAVMEAVESGDLVIEPAPTPTPEEALADERAAMRCTPAQMRLTLHRMDLLTQVQAIADADPEASIVWEYATVIERTSPLIDALGGPNGFTDTQIDDIFRAAMQV